jgi:cell division protein FtsQ
MAVLSLPGWLGWAQKGRGAGARDEPLRLSKRRRASMGTRKRVEREIGLLPSPRRTLMLVGGTVVVGVAVALLLALMSWMANRPMFQVQRAVVVGDVQQADRELVAKRARSLRGNFFNLNLEAAASELKTLPWVRSVKLRRLWPNGLEVEVEEHHPLAHWGDDELLNTFGEVFVADYSGALPRFDGPTGTGQEMMREVQQFNRELAPIHRTVEAADLSERRSWTLRLDDGLTIALGREKIHERLTRFVGVYPMLFKDGSPQGASADLRYASGFALVAPGQGR